MKNTKDNTIAQEYVSLAKELQLNDLFLKGKDTSEIALLCKEMGVDPNLPEESKLYSAIEEDIDTIVLSLADVEHASIEIFKKIENGYSEELCNEVSNAVQNALSLTSRAELEIRLMVPDTILSWKKPICEEIGRELLWRQNKRRREADSSI